MHVIELKILALKSILLPGIMVFFEPEVTAFLICLAMNDTSKLKFGEMCL